MENSRKSLTSQGYTTTREQYKVQENTANYIGVNAEYNAGEGC